MIFLLLLKNKYVVMFISTLIIIGCLYGLYVGYINNIKHQAVLEYKHTQYIYEQQVYHDIVTNDSKTLLDMNNKIDELSKINTIDVSDIKKQLSLSPWSKVQIPQNIMNMINTKVMK